MPRTAASAATWPDLPREDERPEPYRPELVARLEQAVREGRYQPDPRAIAAAMIDRMDDLLVERGGTRPLAPTG